MVFFLIKGGESLNQDKPETQGQEWQGVALQTPGRERCKEEIKGHEKVWEGWKWLDGWLV